jgi:succinyl-CoA synthetase beta subunit
LSQAPKAEVKSPEKIIRESIDPLAGLQPFQTRKLAKQLQFESSQLKAASKLFDGLYRTFTFVEICGPRATALF